MNTFKDSISNRPEQINRLPIVLAVVLLAGLFLLLYQFKEEQRFAVAKDDIINFSKNYRYTKFPFNEKNIEVVIAERIAFIGSGWLLLLMPAVFFFSIVFPRKFLKKHFKKEKKWSI
ncbi:hypothetical protein [Flavobacterium sp. XS2P39]|uniref:hypothetical protein n=1 Tax=Flavobacterium sp. XS2P39 TaxID=3401725 RepID=UPI003AAA6760